MNRCHPSPPSAAVVVPAHGLLRPRRVAALALLLAALGPGAGAADALRFEECSTEGLDTPLLCGTLEVLENPAARDGRRIPIYFQVIKARSAEVLPDPLLFFTGGPGLAATETVPPDLGLLLEPPDGDPRAVPRWVTAFDALWQHRDLLFVDVRGTGRSNGLDCLTIPETGPWSLRPLVETAPFDPKAMRRCRRDLELHADLTQYTTTRAAADVDAVREALGYPEVNVIGGSYGSRIGLEYLRRHGGHVRTATLSFVAPSFASLVTTLPRDVDEVLEIVLAACEADAICSGAFPDVRADLASVAAIDWKNVSTAVTNPLSGERETVALRRDRVVSAIRYMLYSTDLQAQLPLVLHETARGNYEALARMVVVPSIDLTRAFYEGFFAAIKCSEELAFVDYEEAGKIADGSFFGRARLDPETEICMSWPKAEVPSDFHDPVRSTVPTLLFNGDRDVATPARLARQVVQTLPNGLYVELHNRSHLLPLTDSCDIEIMVDFIRQGSVEGLDTSCAAALELPPFVTDPKALDPSFLE